MNTKESKAAHALFVTVNFTIVVKQVNYYTLPLCKENSPSTCSNVYTQEFHTEALKKKIMNYLMETMNNHKYHINTD